MSTIWARLKRAWSREDDDDTRPLVNEQDESPTGSIPTNSARRRNGSDLKSFGRGGVGNIRHLSRWQSLDTRPTNGQDDFSHTVGREPAIMSHPGRVFSVGCGGAGNIRSRNARRGAQHLTQDVAEAKYEARLVREHTEATTLHSLGHGGSGNIFRSRS